MIQRQYILPALVLSLGLMFTACKKDDKAPDPQAPGAGYTVPTQYSFEDENGNSTVNYTGQTQRFDMLEELVTYMKTANTAGVAIDAQTLSAMFANDNYTWSDDNNNGLNETDKQLRNKCFGPHQDRFDTWLNELAVASQSDVAGSNGTAGVVVSTTNPTKMYLTDGNGRELNQIITKGLMGAVMYYQATSYYLSDAKIGNGVNNSTPVDPSAGKYYTAMEHHWDEAFGYFGVPVGFPTEPASGYWGKYSDGRDGLLGTNTRLMNAFLTGRAAIANDDMETKDQQIARIQNAWQDVCAGTAIHYLNAAKANFGDHAIRNHALSECYGFVSSLMYNEGGDFSPTQVDEALALLGDNFYEIEVSDINAAINYISNIAGLDEHKNDL